MSLPLADSSVEKWSFKAWVGSNQQQKVSLLNAGDAGVQQVVWAQVSAAEKKTILSADEFRDTAWPKKTQKKPNIRNPVQHRLWFIIAWFKPIITTTRHTQSYPAPAIGKSSSVHRFSELSLLSRSLRATRASASAIPPAIAATSLPCTPCSYTRTHTNTHLLLRCHKTVNL